MPHTISTPLLAYPAAVMITTVTYHYVETRIAYINQYIDYDASVAD
jgi:hypothetical protein